MIKIDASPLDLLCLLYGFAINYFIATINLLYKKGINHL